MSVFAEIVKEYYEDGTYTKDYVRELVTAGKITAEEYEIITGEKYKEKK